MDGNNTYTEITDSTQQANSVNFQYLGIRTVINTTDLNFRATNWFTLYTGYQFSTRHIKSIEDGALPGDPLTGITAEQDNTIHAGEFGLRLRPIKPLTVTLDAEIGRADHPFVPISEKNYHALSGRVQYKWKSVVLSAFAKTNYNNNSISITAASSRSRNYGASSSWTPAAWFSLDASYNKIHLDTLSGIAYFLSGSLVNSTSVYVSNIHAANLGARFSVRKRVDLYVGYITRRTQATGEAPLRSWRSRTRSMASIRFISLRRSAYLPVAAGQSVGEVEQQNPLECGLSVLSLRRAVLRAAELSCAYWLHQLHVGLLTNVPRD